MEEEENVVKIIVGGTVFITEPKTLKNIPNTLLSELDTFSVHYRRKSRCYFFDRDPVVFRHILQCYRTGKLHLPSDSCVESTIEEFSFWRLDAKNLLASCCLKQYLEIEEKRNVSQNYAITAGSVEEIGELEGEMLGRYRLWLFMEKPSSSRGAQLWILFQVFLIYVLMLVYALMTSVWTTFDLSANNTSIQQYGWGTIPGTVSMPYYVLRFADLGIQLFFTLDLAIRLSIAPSRRKFIKKLTTCVDILCVVTFWIYAIVYLAKFFGDTLDRHADVTMRNIVIVIQVLRLVKVAKLSSNSVQLRSLMLTIRYSMGEIFILNVCFVAVMYLFAVAVYYAEYGMNESQLKDIPISFWWALITTTTVGYGDAVPKSTGGYVVGGLCALTGILLTGLAISILANNLNTYSQLAIQQDKAKKVNCQKLVTLYPPEPRSDSKLNEDDGDSTAL